MTKNTIGQEDWEEREERELPEPVSKDFRKSGISYSLAKTNVEYREGHEASEYFLGEILESLGGHSTQYFTEEVQRLTNKYSFLRDGAWFAKDASVPYCKPLNPRRDVYNLHKLVKYETPPGARAAPLLPALDSLTAEKLGTKPEFFWHEVVSRGRSIGITEGFKKGLCLCAYGLPSIAIRGVTQWHLKDTSELHPEIERFATEGRTIYVLFDQDKKPKTRNQVDKQRMKLSRVLEQKGCDVRFPEWNLDEGKGIDDVLAKYIDPNDLFDRE